MKILHIITGLGDGGAEAVLYNLISRDVNNEHFVISLKDLGRYGRDLRDKHVEVYALEFNNPFVIFSKVILLNKLIRKIRPDVVQTWMYHADFLGGFLARLSGLKNICWGIHNSILAPKLSKRSTIIISRLNAVLSKVVPRKIICCAEKSFSVHADLGYKTSKMVVINNGYDTTRFTPDLVAGARVRASLGIAEDCFLIGAIGRYDPNKDHENLFSALSLFKKSGQDFKCLLAGNLINSENAELMMLIEKYQLQDHLVLLGLRNDIPAVMNALNLLVLSSVAEAFPNVLCEAMACGVPCVSTDVGDAAIIVGETGWIVPPSNSTLLSAAIECAVNELQDPALARQRQDAARSRIIDNFTIERMVESYSAIWSELS